MCASRAGASDGPVQSAHLKLSRGKEAVPRHMKDKYGRNTSVWREKEGDGGGGWVEGLIVC